MEWDLNTISVPRICPADDIDTKDFTNAVPDEIFQKIVAVIRIAVPYTGMIISTRESQKCREKGSGSWYFPDQRRFQKPLQRICRGRRQKRRTLLSLMSVDRRTLDEVVNWLLELGYIPGFCTACYREGRTGDRFMSLVKGGQIANCCHPNALMTLKEYLEDYASPDTREKGLKVIERELKNVGREKTREICERNLKRLKMEGETSVSDVNSKKHLHNIPVMGYSGGMR